jgi:hypothetical protein
MSDAYTRPAVKAITRAARTEHDFGGWLAQVLAQVAGQLGSSDALVEGRPGSWEASLVGQLVKGTVGHDDEYLPAPRTKLTDAKAREIRGAALYGEATHAEIAAQFGVSAVTVSHIATGKTWAWLGDDRG